MFSTWTEASEYNISNALVVILGIGEYDGMTSLTGVRSDYKNVIFTFYQDYQYSVVYFDTQNTLHYCNRHPKTETNTNTNKTKFSQTKLKSSDFKLKWDADEIEQFVQNVQDIINNTDYIKHDALIFFISSHGDSESVILDSNCEEVSLFTIFSYFFGKKCPYLLDKPTIWFIDACRGIQTSLIDLKTPDKVPQLKNGKKGQIGFKGKGNENETTGKQTTTTTTTAPEATTKDEKESKETNESNESNKKENKEKKDQEIEEIGPISQIAPPSKLAQQLSKKMSLYKVLSVNHMDRTRSRGGTIKDKLATLYHNEANCRFIYANPEGYAAIDGGGKGGYLIQAIQRVFRNEKKIVNEKQNLDAIVNQIRIKTRQLVGTGAMQNVEDVNHMNFEVFFKKYEP